MGNPSCYSNRPCNEGFEIMVNKGIKEKQAHRLLEDIQSLSLGAQMQMSVMSTTCKNCEHKEMICKGAALMQNLLDALSRDVMGMMNGNGEAYNEEA